VEHPARKAVPDDPDPKLVLHGSTSQRDARQDATCPIRGLRRAPAGRR
jgi:hypothetical protein